MSKGLNKVQIIGNLGGQPEARYLPDGSMTITMNVATSDTWKDKQTGEQKEKIEWHRIIAFGKLAEIINQYLTKGSKVYCEGKLQTRKWKNQQGQVQYTTEILINEMQMLDSKPTGQQNNNGQVNNFNQGQQPVQNGFNQQPALQQNNQGGFNQQPLNSNQR